MKMIGATSAGSVIIEMTVAQYAAISQEPAPEPTPKSSGKAVPVMAVKRRLDSVRRCLKQLRPMNRYELIRAIVSVHKNTGGIGVKEVDQIVMILQREDFLSIDEEGTVRYTDID